MSDDASEPAAPSPALPWSAADLAWCGALALAVEATGYFLRIELHDLQRGPGASPDAVLTAITGSVEPEAIRRVLDIALLFSVRLAQSILIGARLLRCGGLRAIVAGGPALARDAAATAWMGGALLALAAGLQAAWALAGWGDFLRDAAGAAPAALLRTPQAIAWLLLTAGLAGPAAEELFFRGALQQFLRTRLSPVGAVVGGALLFALAHVPFGHALPLLQFVGGLAFGLLYERTGRLAAPFALHAAVNATLVLLPYVR